MHLDTPLERLGLIGNNKQLFSSNSSIEFLASHIAAFRILHFKHEEAAIRAKELAGNITAVWH